MLYSPFKYSGNKTTIVEKFGSITHTATPFYNGAVEVGGLIYGMSSEIGNILQLNPANDTFTTFGNTGNLVSGGVGRYRGGIVFNEMIFPIVTSANKFARINTTTKAITFFDSNGTSNAYTCGVLGNNGLLYYIPGQTTVVRGFNPTTLAPQGNVTLPSGYPVASTTKWTGAVAVGNFIYAVPGSLNNLMLKIDTLDSIASYIDLSTLFAGAGNFNGFIYPGGEFAYGIPSSQSPGLLKFNVFTETATLIPKPAGGILPGFFNNGKIYSLGTGGAWIFDTVTEKFSQYAIDLAPHTYSQVVRSSINGAGYAIPYTTHGGAPIVKVKFP